MTNRARSTSGTRPEPRVSGKLDSLLARAGLALTWERLWRILAPALCVVALFLSASWLGLWLMLEPVWRIVGVALFAAAFLACLWPLVGLKAPDQREKLARVDRDGGIAHRPATTAVDELALGRDDPETRALWELHRRRAEQRLADVVVKLPEPGLRRRDPWALRLAAVLLVFLGLGVAGGDWSYRLRAAFAWTAPPPPPAVARLDGWVDPPAYTRVPPIILDLAGADSAKDLRVPVGSIVVVRGGGVADLGFDADGLVVVEPPKPEGAEKVAGDKPAATPAPAATVTEEKRWKLEGRVATLTIKRGLSTLAKLTLTPIPDRPPTVAMTQPPQGNARGSLTLSYKTEDDYGITGIEGTLDRAARPAAPGAKPPRPLFPPPTLTLALPTAPGGIGETKSTVDIAQHPWAGARVRIQLKVKDEAGQEGVSEPVEAVLPQRPFTKPLARALVEQRRDLALDAESRPRVLEALHALMIAPERFVPEPSHFLGLKIIVSRLIAARTDEQLIEVADLLWEMAERIEDGDLSQTERDLRAAEEALRQALERGASEEELRRLMQDLRAALDRHLRELAEKMRRDGQRDTADNQSIDRNMRQLREQDLKELLDRMERNARQGARDEAQKLLDEFRDLMDNLRTARPGRPMDPMAREMNKALDDLDAMIRDQQGLRDDTFRNGQQRPRADRGQGQRQPPGAQRSPRAPGQGQEQRDGEEGEGEEGQEGQEGQPRMGQGQRPGQQPGQGLADRQKQLRQKLEELKKRMKGLGMQGEQGLDDAEDQMRQAEGALGQGQNGDAVDAQGRALEALRKGAQGLAMQMQQMQGQGDGMADGEPGEMDGRGDPGSPRGRAAEREDPLGRPQRTRGVEDHQGRVPKAGETPLQRAQRVMEELRRRMSDPSRGQEEMDYLRRLLSPY